MTTFVFKDKGPVEDGDREWRQIPQALVDEYTEVAMRTGAQADDAQEQNHTSEGIPIIGELNADTGTVTLGQPDASMIVLDEDSDGFSFPTTRHAPGY